MSKNGRERDKSPAHDGTVRTKGALPSVPDNHVLYGGDGKFTIYDEENPEAWVESDTTVDRADYLRGDR